MPADSGYFLVKKDKEAVGKILSLIATTPAEFIPFMMLFFIYKVVLF